MLDFSAIRSPILFRGDASCAYRDPAVYYEKGVFYLFFTYVDNREGGPYLTVAETTSRDLVHFTPLRELTPRDKRLNYSSPGNVLLHDGAYYLSLQTYPRDGGEKYGNARSRVYTMRSTDLLHWEEPVLMRVKGDVPDWEMGRMIDPYLVRDIRDPARILCLYKQNGVSISETRDLRHFRFLGHTACGENVCVLPREDHYLIFHSPENGVGILKTPDFESYEMGGETIFLGQRGWDWARGRLTAGFVLDLRREREVGKYLLFFHGSGPEGEETMFDSHASVALAWSDDLASWQWNESADAEG